MKYASPDQIRKMGQDYLNSAKDLKAKGTVRESVSTNMTYIGNCCMIVAQVVQDEGVPRSNSRNRKR